MEQFVLELDIDTSLHSGYVEWSCEEELVGDFLKILRRYLPHSVVSYICDRTGELYTQLLRTTNIVELEGDFFTIFSDVTTKNEVLRTSKVECVDDVIQVERFHTVIFRFMSRDNQESLVEKAINEFEDQRKV